MAGGIEAIAATIAVDLQMRLPDQNKKQREGLALLVATMLDVRGANLMDLTASLPRAAERLNMRYQWISRLLGSDLIDAGEVMKPFTTELLHRLCVNGQRLVLISCDSFQVRHRRCRFSSSVRSRGLPSRRSVRGRARPLVRSRPPRRSRPPAPADPSNILSLSCSPAAADGGT